MRRFVLLLCYLWVTGAHAGQSAPLVPDFSLTPGDVLTADVQAICTRGYAHSVRHVTEREKRQVYRAYSIYHHTAGAYEIDHLISLELGGSNSPRNLWPESYVTEPLNAHVKDRLENRMHELVCAGKLDIRTAQHAIAANWRTAYQTYVGPLPTSQTEPKAHTTSNTAATNETAPNPDGSCPEDAPIKVSRHGIYHLPDDPMYRRTHARHCFATPGDATAAGYRAPR